MSQYRLSDNAKQLAQELYRLDANGEITRKFGLFITHDGRGKIIRAANQDAISNLVPNLLTITSLEQLISVNLIHEMGSAQYNISEALFDAVDNNFEKPQNVPKIHIQAGDGANIALSGNGNVSQTISLDSQKLADELSARFGEEILKQHEQLKVIIEEIRQAENPMATQTLTGKFFNYLGRATDSVTMLGLLLKIPGLNL